MSSAVVCTYLLRAKGEQQAGDCTNASNVTDISRDLCDIAGESARSLLSQPAADMVSIRVARAIESRPTWLERTWMAHDRFVRLALAAGPYRSLARR